MTASGSYPKIKDKLIFTMFLGNVRRVAPGVGKQSSLPNKSMGMFKVVCCITASLVLFLPVAYWLYSAAPVQPGERAALADRFVIPAYCNPEPGERLVYLGGMMFLPVSLFALAFAWRRWEGRLPPLAGLAWGIEIAFAVGLTVLVWLALRGNNYYHLRLNKFAHYPLLAVPLLPAALLAVRWDLGGKRLVRPLLHFLALGLTGVIFLASVLNDKGGYTCNLDFSAVFFPVVQVYEGKALLINCASQYGLYPHLLQPLFALTGLTVLSFTLVMGLLTAGSFAALWVFLSRICENKSAAFIGFAALLFNCWFSIERLSNCDLYFQYFPIRFVFPAFLVLLAWRQLHRPTRRLYWGLLVFLAVGVLWNLDSGVPSLITWAATLCFGELFGDNWRSAARRIAGHLAAVGSVLAAVMGLYTVVIRLRYGAFPDYGQFFYYQSLFFGAGYYKAPLTPPTTWVLVALVYLAGLAYAAIALVARRGSPRAQMVFLLSILGIGLASYYQGRGHPIVLLLVWWPCHLLLALLLDALVLRLRERPARLLPWFVTASLAWLLVGAACSLVPELGFVGTVIKAGYRTMTDRNARPPSQEDAALVARLVPPGEKVVVATPSSAVIHLAAKRPAVNPSSLPGQMILMDEFRQLDSLLAQSPSTVVLIDKLTYSLEDWMGQDRGLRMLVGLLQNRYELVATTQYSYLFARRQDGGLLLGAENGAVLHVGVQDGAPVQGLSFAPFATKPPWSLELVVKPAAAQAPHAALVGNHPGNGLGGFVIAQETPSLCVLVYGDGKAWERVLGFSLHPGEWNYLALVCTEESFTVYLDGKPVASRAVSGLPIEDSPLRLQIGNWVSGDRPFNGAIKEARILRRALSAAEIADAEKSMREQLR